MATDSISTLGIGSSLDLQNILDQLKKADETRITKKENEKAEVQKQVDAYNTVNAKLFSIKSDALNLSLKSNFLDNSASVTDEDVISASVGSGQKNASYSIEVTRQAKRNSWESTAVANKTDIMIAEPATGILDNDTTAVTTASETLTIDYGAPGDLQQIDISLDSGMTFDDIRDAINTASTNSDSSGNQLVKASLASDENGGYYIRLSAASGQAGAESEISVAGFDWVAADTTVAIEQNGASMYVAAAPGTSYQGIANLINDSENNPGVTASIIDNGDSTNPFQLTLTSDETGEDARLTLTNLDGLTEVTGSGAASLNAEFTVNGIAYSRQSNTSIKDVISGVTFDLKNTGTSELVIHENREQIKENITSLVNGINNLISYINSGEAETENTEETDPATDEKETDNPFSGSNNANRIIYKLKSLVTTMVDTQSEYSNLTHLGLEVSRSGEITIDEAILDQAISDNPEAVTELFIGDGTEDNPGLGNIINDGLSNMVSSSGTASTEIDQGEERILRIDKDIETETQRITKKYDTMAAEFTRLDSYLNQITSQGNTLQSMIDAINQSGDN